MTKVTAPAKQSVLAGEPTTSHLSWNSIIISLMSAVILLFTIIIFRNHFPSYFLFRSNGYAWLSVIEIACNLALLLALSTRKGNFNARTWFAIYIAGSALSAVGELFERLSSSNYQAIFWSHISLIGVAIIPVGFYMFAHYLVSKNSVQKNAFLPMTLLITAITLLAIVLGDMPVGMLQNARKPWGFVPPLTQTSLLLLLWLAIIISFALIRIIRFYLTTKDSNLKAQARIIIIGAFISELGGFVLGVSPQYLGFDVLPLGVFPQLALVASVIYAIYRYGTFGVDFSLVTSEVMNALNEIVFITDKDYNVRLANNLAFHTTGYSQHDLYERPLSNLFAAQTFDKIRPTIEEALLEKTFFELSETSIVSRSGAKIAVNTVVTKLDGEPAAYLFAMNDISELKSYFDLEQKRNVELTSANTAFRDQQQAMINLLEDSRDLSQQLQQEKAGVELKVATRTAEVRAERARLEASINSLNIGFVIIDKDKAIVTANAEFSKFFSARSSTKPHLDQLTLALKNDFDLLAVIDECLRTGKSITKDDLKLGERIVRIFIAPIFEDSAHKKSLGAVILVEDITEAKVLERSRDEFFSIASHELRTPLTAIRGNTQMMMEYYKETLSDPSLKEMVDDIHDSSIRLITIVNDFLDTSRLEQGKITFQLTDFDVADLAHEVMQEFIAGEVNPALYIKVAVPNQALPLVHADRDRLKQTIINLVGNGFKFTEKGGVTINLRALHSTIFIEVTDTGKGIPPESRNLLFRKFQQASNNILTRDSTRSTGLGLYISKLIVEGMNGKIYMATSKVGKGSCFVIEVPTAPTNKAISADAK
jgi:PAS domain S-box-containing protein